MFCYLVSHKFLTMSVTVSVSNVGVSQYVSWYLSVWVNHQSMYVIVFVSQSVSQYIKCFGQVSHWLVFQSVCLFDSPSTHSFKVKLFLIFFNCVFEYFFYLFQTFTHSFTQSRGCVSVEQYIFCFWRTA